jgi:hypothetical protein
VGHPVATLTSGGRWNSRHLPVKVGLTAIDLTWHWTEMAWMRSQVSLEATRRFTAAGGTWLRRTIDDVTRSICLAPRHSDIPRSAQLHALLFSNIIWNLLYGVSRSCTWHCKGNFTFRMHRECSTNSMKGTLIGYWWEIREGKRPLWRPRRTWANYMKMVLRDTCTW